MKLSDAIRKRIKFYLKEKNMNVWKYYQMQLEKELNFI